jgi:hypothetical protein
MGDMRNIRGRNRPEDQDTYRRTILQCNLKEIVWEAVDFIHLDQDTGQ